jgi:Tol biopolymer transport system component
MKPTGERVEEIHNSFLVVITTVFSLLLAAVSAASAQSPKVIMPSDIMSLRIPGEADEPQLSPDAKHLVFSVTEPADGGRQTTFYKLWLVDVDGGASPHSLAMPFRTEFSPSWSPDGKYIAFLAEDASQNGGTAGLQVFILEVENSKITKLTSQSGGIERYKWAPDGRQVAYLSRDQPTDQEKAAAEAGNDAIEVDKSPRFAQLWILDLSTRKTREAGCEGKYSRLTTRTRISLARWGSPALATSDCRRRRITPTVLS